MVVVVVAVVVAAAAVKLSPRLACAELANWA